MTAQLIAAVQGQPQAIKAAMGVLLQTFSGLTPSDKPGGLLYFVGPSGVGKTELAEQIAKIGDRPLFVFSMNEYKARHQVATLIGSPPGYVGPSDGKLTRQVRENPNCVVLLDEYEKAHPDIHEALMQVFDKAVLANAAGVKTNFSKAILIMTSNLGADALAAVDWDSPTALDDATVIVREWMTSAGNSAITGRLASGIVPFRPLIPDVVENIMRAKVEKFCKRVEEEYKISLRVEEEVWFARIDELNQNYGLRPISTKLFDEITSGLGRLKLDGRIAEGDRVIVTLDEGCLVVENEQQQMQT